MEVSESINSGKKDPQTNFKAILHFLI
jgi:hypothetical protein